MTEKRFAVWRFCPECRSYRFTWKPYQGRGKCQDCGHEVSRG